MRKFNTEIWNKLFQSYVGTLTLSKGTQSAIQDLRIGLPLLYTIKFPINNPLPKVSEISHNGYPICYGEGKELFNLKIMDLSRLKKFFLFKETTGSTLSSRQLICPIN